MDLKESIDSFFIRKCESMNETLAELLFPHIDKSIEDYEALYPKRNVEGYVTRFAPSPTGFVHIGSLYTSYISYLMAHQSKGICYLRIEDTDQKREVEHGIEGIINDLKEFGITFDESPLQGGKYGPYIQSERKNIYQACVKELVKKGLAYPCFMSEEELKEIRKKQEEKKERIGIYDKYAKYRDCSYEEVAKRVASGEKYVIRLKSNGKFENKVDFHDEIKGDISFPENDLDVVLLKEDGIPTYHLAHVVDDHFMRTNLVVRGDEWLSSIPIHHQLFEVLGFKRPLYAHISPLTKREGDTTRKLSKRKDPECSVSYYYEKGIPTEALKLYFKTIMNPDFEQYYLEHPREVNFIFELRKMPVGGTLFDEEKLDNIAKTYFSYLSAEEIYEGLLSYTKAYDEEFYHLLVKDKERMLSILNIERGGERPRKDIGCYRDVKLLYWYFFARYFEEQYDEKLSLLDTSNYDLKMIAEYFETIYEEEDDENTWFTKVKEFASSFGYAKEVKEYKQNPDAYKGHIGLVCEMIRVATCLEKRTPNLYHILKVLGKQECIRRVEKMLLVNSK